MLGLAPADTNHAQFLSVAHLEKISTLSWWTADTSEAGDPGRTNCKLRTADHLLATRANPAARGTGLPGNTASLPRSIPSWLRPPPAQPIKMQLVSYGVASILTLTCVTSVLIHAQ